MLFIYKNSSNLSKIFFCIFFLSILFPQNGRVDYTGKVKSDYIINGQEYITGDNGDLLMYVNIWGHVENPGTYLVYDGIDLLTLLSLAGGPSSGAQLKRIQIINSDGSSYNKKTINLESYMNNPSQIIIKPHDTIYVKESTSSFIFSKTNVINTLLQIINIAYVMTKF